MRFFHPQRALARMIRQATNPSSALFHFPQETFLRPAFVSAELGSMKPLRSVLNNFFQEAEQALNPKRTFGSSSAQHQRAQHQNQHTSGNEVKRVSGAEEDKVATESSSSSPSSSSSSSHQQNQHQLQRHQKQHAAKRSSSSSSSPLMNIFAQDPFFSPFLPMFPSSSSASRLVPSEISIDIFSSSAGYTIEAALPGVSKQDIKLLVEDNLLTIEAERSVERRSTPRNHSSSASHANATENAKVNHEDASSSTAPSSSSSSSAHEAKVEASAATSDHSTEVEGHKLGANAAEEGTIAEEEEQVEYMESSYGRISRTLQLPEDVQVEKLSAKYENGILRIELPRIQVQPKAVPKKIQIQ